MLGGEVDTRTNTPEILKRNKNMKRTRLKTNKHENNSSFVALLIIAVGLLWVAVFTSIFRIRQLETVVYEYKKPVIIEVQKPVQVEEYIPSENTLKLMDKYSGMTGEIYRYFGSKYGQDWRKWAELIARESGFNKYAINPSSGACGLAQALPCEKMACDLSDTNCQLQWIEEYVLGRYGSIDKTLYHHDIMNWY